jgi:haloacid dehalogenase-like hydrolase
VSGGPGATVALIYDFDGTLSPRNMQEYSFIPQLGMNAARFWRRVQLHAKRQNADPILAYMDMMLDLARQKSISIQRKDFVAAGKSIALYRGVTSWFARQAAYGRRRGVRVHHYIISSGLREMIQGSAIGRKFKTIYASGFMYDDEGRATWPALALNYTTKTQFLFRINKGSFNVYDDTLINAYLAKEKRPVPFENMIFIGDGLTDVPCMRLVKDQGGHSIAVYRSANVKSRRTAEQLAAVGRVNFIAPSDYSAGRALDRCVRAIIDRIVSAAVLERLGRRE